MMDDASERGEVVLLPPVTISGYTIPATYWRPGVERNPRVALYDASATLTAACACRGSLHQECVWPTIKRGEEVLPMSAPARTPSATRGSSPTTSSTDGKGRSVTRTECDE